MADDPDPFEHSGEHEVRREGSHKSKSKVSSKDKSKKPGYPRKGRKREEESPPPSPSYRLAALLHVRFVLTKALIRMTCYFKLVIVPR